MKCQIFEMYLYFDHSIFWVPDIKYKLIVKGRLKCALSYRRHYSLTTTCYLTIWVSPCR